MDVVGSQSGSLEFIFFARRKLRIMNFVDAGRFSRLVLKR